jgi:hypothetical protein
MASADHSFRLGLSFTPAAARPRSSPAPHGRRCVRRQNHDFSRTPRPARNVERDGVLRIGTRPHHLANGLIERDPAIQGSARDVPRRSGGRQGAADYFIPPPSIASIAKSIAAFAVWRNQCARLTYRYLLNRRSASAMRSISR